MSIHQNARLTLARRFEMVRKIVEQMLAPAEAAVEADVSAPPAESTFPTFAKRLRHA
ncbi:MAG: hypothetical protein ACREVE_17860 [Gammaproteobacteria bacterium]